MSYLKRQHNGQTDAQLQSQLATQHLTMTDLRRHLERAIIAFHVRDGEAFDRIVVTDEEARRYFDAHLDEFALQTFDGAKADLIMRLRREKLGTRCRSRICNPCAWPRRRLDRPENQRAYEEGLRQRVAPHGRATPAIASPVARSRGPARASGQRHVRHFMQLDANERLEKFQRLTPANQAALLREHLVGGDGSTPTG